MGIWRNGHEITGRWRNGHDVQEVWRYIDGAWRMVWNAIRSCFSNGWDNNQGWNNDEGWNDNL